MNSAARVGALLVVFAGLAFGAISVLGRGLFGAKTNTYYVKLADAAGLTLGTKVLIAGVQVGSIQKVELDEAAGAKLTLSVKDEVKIPKGTVAVIPSSLIGLGDSSISLVYPKIRSEFLATDSEIAGTKANSLDSFLPNGQETVAELTKTIVAFRKILEDKAFFGEIKGLMASTNKTMQEFGKTANSVNGLINENRASLSASLSSAAKTMDNVALMTQELSGLLASKSFKGDTKAILANLKSTTERVDKLMTDINSLVGDPQLKASLMDTTKNVATITESGTKMAASGEKIAANVEVMTADGTQITKKTVVLMDKINEIATKASEIEDQIKGTLDKVGGALKGGGASPLQGLTSQMDVIYDSKPSYARTDVTFRLPQKDGEISFGLWDAFYSNRLTAQYGVNLNDRLGYRYGIFASRPGLGVDYNLSPRTSWRGDLWDINDPRFDFRFSHQFGKGIVGWLGMDRVFKDNSPTIGIGFRK